MPTVTPPLAFFCIHVLARLPDQLHYLHHRRVPANPALLDALHHEHDPCLWAALAQLVHPLPPDLHERVLPLSHPAVPLLQNILDSPDFSLVTLVALPNCVHLRDDDIANFRFLHRLLALDLRGCSISSYALTALARGLVVDSRSGPWGIRLLSLHGCPNIDNDVLCVLPKFPLLSAVDLRFTRCIPTVVNIHLSPLGFRPSDNNTLFHPAPLSLALCSLEKVALTAAAPISLYSCPPQSVFRLHIDKLGRVPSHTKKTVPVARSSTSHSTIRTTSSAENTVVFIPPLRKTTKSESPRVPEPSSTLPSVSMDRPTQPNPVFSVSSFYDKAPAHSRKSILPLSAQAVQSPEGGKLDPLAIARSPPLWTTLDTYRTSARSNPLVAVTCCQSSSASDSVENSQRTHIARWIGHTLSDPLRVDRTRLHKRGSDAVADMVHQFTSKRPKVESEFALAKTQAKIFVKSRNPFVRGVRSVFAESITDASEKPQSPVHEPARESAMQLRACRSLPSERVQNVERTCNKPLKPITSLKPPILPKELLPPMPQYSRKPRSDLKQTRLSFKG